MKHMEVERLRLKPRSSSAASASRPHQDSNISKTACPCRPYAMRRIYYCVQIRIYIYMYHISTNIHLVFWRLSFLVVEEMPTWLVQHGATCYLFVALQHMLTA